MLCGVEDEQLMGEALQFTLVLLLVLILLLLLVYDSGGCRCEAEEVSLVLYVDGGVEEII